jgi:hypothetical protein
MKRAGQITGILLMLLLAGNTTLDAQRGNRGGMDTTRMNRPERGAGFIQGPNDQNFNGRGQGPMAQNFRGRGQGPAYQNFRGRGQGPMARMRGPAGRQQFGLKNGNPPAPFGEPRKMQGGPGRDGITNIPNLTEKQKTELADLKKEQQAEMKKFRDEMNTKMQSIREDHKKKMLGLLTEEQKKAIAGAPANTEPADQKSRK